MTFDAPTTASEDTMTEITAPRYGHQPTAAFAATRAFADRRRERVVAIPQAHGTSLNLLRRLATLLRSA